MLTGNERNLKSCFAQRRIMRVSAPLQAGSRTPVVESAASRVDDGHLADVIILDQLLDKKRRDIRTRNP